MTTVVPEPAYKVSIFFGQNRGPYILTVWYFTCYMFLVLPCIFSSRSSRLTSGSDAVQRRWWGQLRGGHRHSRGHGHPSRGDLDEDILIKQVKFAMWHDVVRIVANPDLAGERVERSDVGVDQVHPGEAITAMSGEDATFRYRSLPHYHKVGHMF